MEGLLTAINEIVHGIVSVTEQAQDIAEVQEQSYKAAVDVKEKRMKPKKSPNSSARSRIRPVCSG
ncbi:hypothetical protein ACFTAO_22205 [Paenibacillus rhizoplanae]